MVMIIADDFVFIRQRKTKKEEERSDLNPVYATYEVHDDPVAEVRKLKSL